MVCFTLRARFFVFVARKGHNEVWWLGPWRGQRGSKASLERVREKAIYMVNSGFFERESRGNQHTPAASAPAMSACAPATESPLIDRPAFFVCFYNEARRLHKIIMNFHPFSQTLLGATHALS